MEYTDEELSEMAWEYAMRFEEINIEYIQLMGEHIRDLGRLTELDIHRMRQMARMGIVVKKVNDMLAKTSKKTLDDIYNLYDDLLNNEYKNAEELYQYRGKKQPNLKKNKSLANHLESVKRLTKGTFYNLSNTTSVHDEYKTLLDAGISAIQTGLADYQSVIRKNLKDAEIGARVEYASGVTRRLDSAMYMNIQEGVRQVNMGVREIMGEQFGADGIELSAHYLCAPDHIPVQGRQYAKGEKDLFVDGNFYESFDKMNDDLRRRIGTCNCKHYTFPIILGISEPVYNKMELEEYRDNSNKEITVDGKSRTKYQWSQQMRALETKIRYAQEKKIFAKASGDKEMVRKYNSKIKKLYEKYDKICEKTGLEPNYKRAYVPNPK